MHYSPAEGAGSGVATPSAPTTAKPMVMMAFCKSGWMAAPPAVKIKNAPFQVEISPRRATMNLKTGFTTHSKS
jgi:hypothetical protein